MPSTLNSNLVARRKKNTTRHTHTGRRSGRDQITRPQRQPRAEMGDLFSHAEYEISTAAVLHEPVVDPEPDCEVPRIRMAFSGTIMDRPGSNFLPALLTDPVPAEGRSDRHIRTADPIAGGQIVHDGQAGDVLHRALDWHVAGRAPADDEADLRFQSTW